MRLSVLLLFTGIMTAYLGELFFPPIYWVGAGIIMFILEFLGRRKTSDEDETYDFGDEEEEEEVETCDDCDEPEDECTCEDHSYDNDNSTYWKDFVKYNGESVEEDIEAIIELEKQGYEVVCGHGEGILFRKGGKNGSKQLI